jgi:hypothetical protein
MDGFCKNQLISGGKLFSRLCHQIVILYLKGIVRPDSSTAIYFTIYNFDKFFFQEARVLNRLIVKSLLPLTFLITGRLGMFH